MNLNNKLLNVLPVEEREARAKPTTVRAKAYETGLEGLKNLISDRSKDLSSFKYDSGSDRLYAYFKSISGANALWTDAKAGQIAYGKIAVKRSGDLSVRFDGASKFTKVIAVTPQEAEVGDWATFVVDSKQIFRDVFAGINGVTVTFSMSAGTSTLFAYATSSRKLEAEYALAVHTLKNRADVTVTNNGAYGVSVKFIFDPSKPREVPLLQRVTAQPAVNTLREALAVEIGPDILSPIKDRVTSEVYEQFQRILEGERLAPAPLIARYRDGAGRLFTAFYLKTGVRVDLEAIVASLRLHDRQMHTMSSDIGHVIVEGVRVDRPALIIMTDVVDVDAVHVTVVAPGVNKQVKLFKQK